MDDDVDLVKAVVAEGLDDLEKVVGLMTNLHQAPERAERVDQIFRVFHSIKGAASMMGLRGIGRYAHRVENCLEQVRKERVTLDEAQVDLLVEAFDGVSAMLQQVDPVKKVNPSGDAYHPFLVRICTAFQVDPPSPPKAAPAKRKRAVKQAPKAAPAEAELADSLRVRLSTITELAGTMGELFQIEERLRHLIRRMEESNPPGHQQDLRSLSHEFEHTLDRLYHRILETRKTNIRAVSGALSRLVRTTSRQTKKQVELILEGESVTIDKQTLDQLQAPLVHIVRNSVDHGIEPPAVRDSLGKSRKARVTIDVRDQDKFVVVTVSDDGKGLDAQAIRDKAISRSLISESEGLQMSPDELYELIFRPGFSTAKQVSEISGRGVGLDVVRTTVERAGGSVEVTSRPGAGTTFRLRLPKPSSPVREGVTLKVGELTYLVPVESIRAFYASTQVSWTDSGEQLWLQTPLGVFGVAHLPGPERHRVDPLAAKLIVLLEDSGGRVCGVPLDSVVGTQKALVMPIDGIPASDVFDGCFVLGGGGVGFSISVERLVAHEIGPN